MKKSVRFVRPYPKQQAFLRAKTARIAYGGARGGGKSEIARMKAILLCLKYPGIQVLFMRRTYPELKENHLLPARKILNGIAKYSSMDKAFEFPNGSRLKFGYCRNDSDLLQYQGQAYDVIFLEECTQFPENVYTTMTESNRTSPLIQVPFKPRMYFTCNPGGVGHAWFKRLFIDREYRNQEHPDDYTMIQATVYDNEYLMKHSPDYVRALENLPEDRKRAMLYGDWNVFEGQYFPEFRTGVHTCAPFTIPDHWIRYRFFDYGFDMFAAYWAAMDETGTAYVYREVYEGKDKVDQYGNPGEGLTIAQAAERLTKLTPRNEEIFCTFAPPDMWNRQRDTGRSAAEIFAAYGVPLYKVSNDRVQGWWELKDWLKVRTETEKPRIVIFETCANLIRTLPLCQHDEKNPDDVAKDPHEVTHAPDALRYFVSGQPLAAQTPNEWDEDTPLDYDEEVEDFYDYDGG